MAKLNCNEFFHFYVGDQKTPTKNDLCLFMSTNFTRDFLLVFVLQDKWVQSYIQLGGKWF